MALKTRAELKAFFETGDFPTESQFADFIDSVNNILENNSPSWSKVTKTYADFQPNPGTTGSIQCFEIPANTQVVGIIVILRESFICAPASPIFVWLTNTSDTIAYSNLSSFEASQPISNFTGRKSDGILGSHLGIDNTTGGFSNLHIILQNPISKIDNLSAGILDVYYGIVSTN